MLKISPRLSRCHLLLVAIYFGLISHTPISCALRLEKHWCNRTIIGQKVWDSNSQLGSVTTYMTPSTL